MDKKEFLEQMVAFGQELLAQESKPKINLKAKENLQKLYNALENAVNAAADLELIFQSSQDKRVVKATKAVNMIMKVQELMNPLAECEDIDLI